MKSAATLDKSTDGKRKRALTCDFVGNDCERLVAGAEADLAAKKTPMPKTGDLTPATTSDKPAYVDGNQLHVFERSVGAVDCLLPFTRQAPDSQQLRSCPVLVPSSLTPNAGSKQAYVHQLLSDSPSSTSWAPNSHAVTTPPLPTQCARNEKLHMDQLGNPDSKRKSCFLCCRRSRPIAKHQLNEGRSEPASKRQNV